MKIVLYTVSSKLPLPKITNMPSKKTAHVKGMVSALIAEMSGVSIHESKPKKTVKKPAKTVVVVAPRKKALKVKTESKFGRMGQTKDTPPEKDALRRFYCSLLRQKPDSKMAMKWCLEHGLIPDEEIKGVLLVLEMNKCKI